MAGLTMRCLLRCGLLVAVLFSLAAPAEAGDRPAPRSDLWMGDGAVSFNHDAASGKRGLSYDVNASLAFLNIGLSARVWDGAVTGWNKRQVSDELIVYGGVGLADLLTVQRGWSRAGARYRVRALIPIGKHFPFPNRGKRPGGLSGGEVIFTPFLETGAGKKVYGLGLVVVI